MLSQEGEENSINALAGRLGAIMEARRLLAPHVLPTTTVSDRSRLRDILFLDLALEVRGAKPRAGCVPCARKCCSAAYRSHAFLSASTLRHVADCPNSLPCPAVIRSHGCGSSHGTAESGAMSGTRGCYLQSNPVLPGFPRR